MVDNLSLPNIVKALVMRAVFPALLCCGLLLATAPCQAAPSSAPLKCSHEDGYLAGPFAPSPAAARTIYLAIRSSVEPVYKLVARRWIVVEDEGDRWSVYTKAPLKTPEGKWIFLQGGGGLALEIDKCTAAVKHAINLR